MRQYLSPWHAQINQKAGTKNRKPFYDLLIWYAAFYRQRLFSFYVDATYKLKIISLSFHSFSNL